MYVLGQWLVHKEYIVTAWIDQHFHAGTTVSSRIEGAHHYLANWIGSSSKSLQPAWQATEVAITTQLREISRNTARIQSATPLSLSGQFHHQLLGKITRTALHKLRIQHSYATNQSQENPICTGLFTSSWLILCWHTIKTYLESNRRKF